MLLYVLYTRVLTDEKAVHAVMVGVLTAAVIDAAAGDYHDVRIVADEEVVVYDVLQSALAHDDRDVDALVLRSGLYAYVDARLILFRGDLNVCRGAAPGGRAVCTDIVGSLRHLVQVGDLGQKLLLYLSQHCCVLLP